MSGSVPGTSGASLPKRPHLESGNEACLSGKKSAGGSVSTSSAETRRRGGMGVSTPDVPVSSASSASSSSTCPPLFCDFWCFNVKSAAAHHPVIQKEVDELLAKGAIELSSGGAGCYYSMFVMPKHTGGLRPILNLKCFNHYKHIPSFKIPTLKHVWQLIQHGDYAFSIDQQDAYLHIPIVKHHHHFLHFVWHNVPSQWKVLPFGLATAPRVFAALTKPILFLCHCKGLHIFIYLDDILVLLCSKWAGKRTHLFLCSLLVCLGLHINFSKPDLHLNHTFCFLGLCWDTLHM